MKRFIHKISPDKLGISASIACAVHCAVLPLFLSSLSLFGFDILHNKIFEYSMIGLAGLIGCSALYHGYKKHHHKKLPLIIFISGFLLLAFKEVFLSLEIILLVPAAILIITAHVLNLRLCSRLNINHTNNPVKTEQMPLNLLTK